MFIIYVLIVKRKAFAEFYEKISWVNFLSISSYTLAAHPPPPPPGRQKFVCLFIMVFMSLWEMIVCVESADKVAQM